MDDKLEIIKKQLLMALEENKEKNPKVYLNMTDGIEALPLLTELEIEPNFCFIQSSHFESKSLNQVFIRMGADFLMALALGQCVIIIDFGVQKEYSRAVYQGIPFIKYVLEKLWYNKIPKHIEMTPRDESHITYDVLPSFCRWFARYLNKKTRDYLKKFRPYAIEPNQCVNIVGISTESSYDGHYEIYSNIIKNWYLNKR